MVDSETWTQRVERAGVLAAQLAQVHSDLVGLATELLTDGSWAGVGVRSPEHWLQVYTGLSLAQARHLVRVAERVEELPTTTGMLAAGRLSLDQAAVIADHVPADYEQQVAELGETLSVTQLSRVAAKYPYERPVQRWEHPRRPPAERESFLTMSTTNGRFRLRFETNELDGALVEQAIREAKDALFTAGDERATLADGLVEACSRSLAATESPNRREHYKIVLHLDTDTRTWIGRKGAIPSSLADAITCDGAVTPIWETDGHPVNVGRSQRIVPLRNRRLVEDRDSGCRYPGCHATGHLDNHHLVHWNQGGSTDLDQLVSLCSHHHNSHHRGDYSITGNPNTPDGLVFLDRWGFRIGKYLPQHPIEAPDRPPPDRRHRGVGGALRGERLDLGAVYFRDPGDDP
ncbi:HNH endonuclease [Aestuariimicrobium sp. p3-SID1156]|uniref:HNH endonuclease signature motif containing protein n=1 Tax=Aestuariimicrobium sp. p3-SID1156 TaxID=2916038 RepID=UPI00223BCBBE|nr:HNH endonuclease signature motif containing protein [Aestuariimicrobium sp. p3-SID1156]MCT1458145.1 HNH endonuclease [Aestuariimicrobium sp. p3-SID1156]